MSQNYQQYNSNPYGQAEAGYGQSNPYGGGGYGSNPYGGNDTQLNAPGALQHAESNYSQQSQYSQAQGNGAGLFGDGTAHNSAPAAVPAAAPGQQAYQAGPPERPGPQPLSRDAFLQRVEGIKRGIGELTSDIQAIANVHQRMLSSPDNRSSAELESIITQTQIRNTSIKDQIKFLEVDVVRDPNNSLKTSQLSQVKNSFKAQLKEFQDEEAQYSRRYRDAIERQYRIINPDATDAEVKEAANADWGDEGVFTQALKTNRSGQASSVLGAVRARHNDIQRIEKTMVELATLFTQLNEQVVYQEEQVNKAELQTEQVKNDTEHANVQLGKANESARRARKLKWWCLGICVLIIAIIALVLGIYFGVVVPGRNNNKA